MRWGIIAALVLWCCVGLAEEPAPDEPNKDASAVRKQLDDATANYYKTIKDIENNICQQIDELVEQSADRGDLDIVLELRKQKKEFLEDGVTPQAPVFASDLRRAKIEIKKAISRINDSYESAVSDLTKLRDFEMAVAVRKEWELIRAQIDPSDGDGLTAIKQAKLKEAGVVAADISEVEDKKIPKEDGIEVNSIGMKLRLIPAGTFAMQTQLRPPTKATITKPFYLGIYEVTQKEWEAVMGPLPENTKTKGDNMPVQGVSWNAATDFCKRLSQLPDEKKNGYHYRLPTETEWEYSCRAGTTTKYFFGDDYSLIDNYAWCESNSDKIYHQVGSKRPNQAGLYDMYGNVEEWCFDSFGVLPRNTTDYRGAIKIREDTKVIRGACISGGEINCLSVFRSADAPDSCKTSYGFRVVMTKSWR